MGVTLSRQCRRSQEGREGSVCLYIHVYVHMYMCTYMYMGVDVCMGMLVRERQELRGMESPLEDSVFSYIRSEGALTFAK